MDTRTEEPQKGGCLKTLGIMLITVIISVIATVFVINYYLFPKQLEPVELNQREESKLNQKLKHFGLPTVAPSSADSDSNALTPEPYSEVGAKREITFSEKELNAMLAKNTNLADKAAIDLADNLASVKMIIPLDPDFPILGGKTLKANAGAELAYANGRPIVILKGVSVWGVPIPNAWLGNLKNVDLVKEFGGDEGFWKSFSDGVENIRVVEGQLKIKLKE
ncbi:MAG: arginine N-succinyltransferase [Thiotrichaceae bacterium]|nr:arginine N-succinyltransferase [Thiotrichaceae bacterium]